MNDEKQTLQTILETLRSVLHGDLNKEFLSPADDEATVEIFRLLNILVLHLNEIKEVSYNLADGKLDGKIPDRRNYLAAPLKTLQSRLSTLTWNVEQAIKRKVVGNMVYDGELYKTINTLIEQIANNSLNQQNNTESDVLSMDSWKYHQLLLALGKLTIMVLLVNNKGEIVYLNEQAKTIFSKITSFFEVEISDYKELVSYVASLAIQKEAHIHLRQEIFDSSRNKWFTIISETIKFLNDQAFQMYMISDITNWKKKEIILEEAANIDSMTGIYNKHGGLEKLKLSIQDFDKDRQHCVAFVDLDGLKYTNDTFGHKEGDFFIKKSVKVLLHFARQTDIFVRFGGDEFVIFFLNCSYNNALNRLSNAHQKIINFNRTSTKPYPLDFSFGIVQFNYTENTDILKIIEQADKEMYVDKKRKKTMRK